MTCFRRLLAVVVATGLLAALTACGTATIDRNLAGIGRLRQGMTKTEVEAIMGAPLTGEVYHEPDIWYYYTCRRWADGAITRDECTPVVFADGRVIGWGQDFLKRHRHEQW